MSRDNGEVLGSDKILNNGLNSSCLNVVLLAEGFKDNQQDDFEDRCDEFVAVLKSDKWFRGLVRAINVHRVKIESDDSGTDDPDSCEGGTGAQRDTFFDSSLCSGSPAIRRAMDFDSWLASEVCDDEVPEWDVAIIIVNSQELGGSSDGRIAIITLAGDWAAGALHELGHSAFGLADEYSYWKDCDEDGHDHPWWGLESWEPNTTRALHGFPPQVASSRFDVKWGHLIDPDTPVPTLRNRDCEHCPPDNNSTRLADDEIGLFEGAFYYHCDHFRPAFRCRMNEDRSDPFCLVCIAAAHEILLPFLPSGPNIVAEIDNVDMGDICSGGTRTVTFRIANLGEHTSVVEIETTVNTLEAEIKEFLDLSDMGIPDGTLLPGHAARVSLTFGPLELPTPAEDSRTIEGDIKILVDRATEETLPFKIVVRQPSVAAEITPVVMDFGDVAVGLTMYRRLRVSNVATPCALPMEANVNQLTGPFSFVETIDDEIEMSVAGDETRDVYIRFVAPDQPGAIFNGSVRVQTADPNVAERFVSLRARAVAPFPVDTVMVIDRSRSMEDEAGEADQEKIDHAIFAVDLYTSLLRDNDGIGLVRFNTHSNANDGDLLVDLSSAGPPDDGKELVRRVLTVGSNGPLEPRGNTSIGAGMLLGSEVLEGGSSDRRAIVVLTDGRHNEGVTIEEAKETILAQIPAQRLFAVGFGLDQLIEEVASATSESGGVAFVTGDVVEDKEFLLQKLFVQILSDEADWSMLSDPVRRLSMGESESTSVRVGEVDLVADFIIVFRPGDPFPKYLRTWLRMPNGEVINSDNLDQYPGTQYVLSENHLFYRVPFPFVGHDPRAHIGRWELGVANEATGATQLVYAVMARAFSDLRMQGQLQQDGYQPGTPMVITLKPILYGLATEAIEPIRAQVILPNQERQALTLHRGRDEYRGTFRNTRQVGPYHFDCTAVILTPSGVPVTRTRYLGGVILPAKKKKDRLTIQ